MNHIAAKYERARNQAHVSYYYSMRDSYAREELEETLSMIDYLQSRELREHVSKTAAINLRRHELHLA
jgi:hypothetical protein